MPEREIHFLRCSLKQVQGIHILELHVENIYHCWSAWRTCDGLTGWSLLLFASLRWLASVPDEKTGTTQTRTWVWNLPCAQMAHIVSPQLVSNAYPHTNAHARTHEHAHTLRLDPWQNIRYAKMCVLYDSHHFGHLNVKASGAQSWYTAEYMSGQDTFHTYKWGTHIFTNTHSPKPFDWGGAMVGIWKVLGSLVLSERSGSQGFKSSKEKSVLGLEELDGKTFTK